MQDSANIGQVERVMISDLSTYINNPREGDVDAIAASMKVNGVYKPLVVNRGTHTGRPYEVLAGNHSLKALRQIAEQNPDDDRWQRADVYVVDVDEDRAAKIVLADNRTSDLGGYDDRELVDLLQSVSGDLEGTGYDDNAVAELLHALEDDTPDFEPEDDYDAQLDEFKERRCHNCGYDVANNPEQLPEWGK